MTAAERATLAYIDSQIRQAEGDARHLEGVAAATARHLEGVVTARRALGDALSRLADWRRVREAVDYLFTMRD